MLTPEPPVAARTVSVRTQASAPSHAEPRSAVARPPADRRPGDDPLAALLQRAVAQRCATGTLSRTGTPLLQRGFDPEFQFGPGSVELETISNQDELNKVVEHVIDERYGGVRSLFEEQDVFGSSASAWRDRVYEYLQEAYVLQGGLGSAEVLTAVGWVKDKYREETLLHMARVHAYWAPNANIYSKAVLKEEMEAAGVYLDDDDNETLQAIFDTEGKFARTAVALAPLHLLMSEDGNIIVWLDHHQQKHQYEKIPEFPAYEGKAGTKFADGKGVAWHRAYTAVTVREEAEKAVNAGKVTATEDFVLKKRPIDGIVYDLTVSLDEPTGKYVASYHCNPLRSEV